MNRLLREKMRLEDAISVAPFTFKNRQSLVYIEEEEIFVLFWIVIFKKTVILQRIYL
jgi:non-homologous end joining protein Ku